MKLRLLHAAAAAVLLLGAGAPARAADASGLVDEIVQAYGGQAAVEKLQAFRVEFEVQSTLQKEIGKGRRDFEVPDRLRVEIAYPAEKEVRILNGEKGWRGDDRVLRSVKGLPLLAMVYQMIRSTVPQSLAARAELLEDRGLKAKEGSQYRVLGLAWSRELDLAFWIDPKDKRVVWVEGVLLSGGGRTTFATKYGNFQRIEGVLFPFAEENFASGQHTGATKILAVTFAPKDLGPFDPSATKP